MSYGSVPPPDCLASSRNDRRHLDVLTRRREEEAKLQEVATKLFLLQALLMSLFSV